VASVGLVGLMVIVLLTAFNGIVEEHSIGHSFEEALPFTALLVVFLDGQVLLLQSYCISTIHGGLAAVRRPEGKAPKVGTLRRQK